MPDRCEPTSLLYDPDKVLCTYSFYQEVYNIAPLGYSFWTALLSLNKCSIVQNETSPRLPSSLVGTQVQASLWPFSGIEPLNLKPPHLRTPGPTLPLARKHDLSPSSAWPSLWVVHPVLSNASAPGRPQPRESVHGTSDCSSPVTHSVSTLEPHSAYSSHSSPLLQTLLHLASTHAITAAHQQQTRTIHIIFELEPAGRLRLRTTMCSSDIFLGFLAILFPPLPGELPPPRPPTSLHPLALLS